MVMRSDRPQDGERPVWICFYNRLRTECACLFHSIASLLAPPRIPCSDEERETTTRCRWALWSMDGVFRMMEQKAWKSATEAAVEVWEEGGQGADLHSEAVCRDSRSRREDQ